MIVDVQSLNAYSGNWEDNDEAVAMKELFLGSAEEIVSDYLRYSPVLGLHADIVLSGNGTGRLQLPSRPVRSLERMEIDGCTMDVALFRLDDDRITAAYEKLTQDVQPVFAKMYQQQAGGAPGADGGATDNGDTEFHQ